MKRITKKFSALPGAMGVLSVAITGCSGTQDIDKPNIIIIYADDLGYGDISCYGATEVNTPNIDRLANQGLLFSSAYCTSATSTPSRYSLLTGEYAWRVPGTGVARGDAPAIIKPGKTTMASMLQQAGYVTGVVGKWHLGLGAEEGADWNGEISHTPLDIGFDYSYLIPATGDRVPCVYVENRRVVGLDPNDPIKVSFTDPILVEPTGKDHPELLKMHPSHGHDMTIVNGVSRIGWMSGGKSALWVDEDMADTITSKAVKFIEKNSNNRFFLYFATHDIHVPRLPHKRFEGVSGMGPRGDAIIQFDWSVGEILNAVERLGLSKNTLIIVTSDNGPVVDDGYHDQSVELLGNHKPAGPLRGGKYSSFEAGTRVLFIAGWKGTIKPGRSEALFSQIDLMASFAELSGQVLPSGTGPDSFSNLGALLGRSESAREWVIEQGSGGKLSIVKDGWKYIEPGQGPRVYASVNIESGRDSLPQLYNLKPDIGEKNNMAASNPEIVSDLADLLETIKSAAALR
jgi:arylsulfatase A-like enzyme